MKRVLVAVAAVVAAVVVLGLVGGCTPGVTGIVPNPLPVVPSTWIPSWQIQEAINAPGVIVSLERNGYNSVPVARIQNTANQLVLDSHWGALTAAQAFIVQMKRSDPNAAVGLALLGPPSNAQYWALTVDVVQGQLIVRLVDPLGQQIVDWVNHQEAFVCM